MTKKNAKIDKIGILLQLPLLVHSPGGAGVGHFTVTADSSMPA